VVRVREFELGDLARILAIEQASFKDDAWDERLFRAYHRKCPDLFLVAAVHRRIAAYSITCVGARTAELASIAVDPCVRRQGVAQALLDYTLDELRSLRIKTWQLMVSVDNRPAIGFYEKYGFLPTKRVKRYYGAGRDAWRMRYPVSMSGSRPEE
jgi:[ribosomal protein S18]-alanine N-acetyltransferase